MDDESVIELHLKKTVEHAQNKARLSFDVAHDLFSSFEVDLGTRLLLRTLAKAGWVGRRGRILDLGCGYGPIGVTLGALNPEARVTMADRDLLAVRFAAHNAARNGVTPEGCLPSLGYDDLTGQGPFDLIACNVPAKAGDEAIRSMVLDGAGLLTPDGMVAVVVIDRIAPLVERLVEAEATVVARASSRGYLALLYRPVGDAVPSVDDGSPGGFERGVYDRGRRTFTIDGTSFEMETVWGLPEFDTPSYSTGLAGRHLAAARGGRHLFVEPGQGLLPAFLAAIRPEARLVLRSRDLLALRNAARAARSLPEVEVELTLEVEVGEGIDVAVRHIADDEPLEATLVAVRPLLALPSVILHGSSTRISRVSQALRLDDHERLRYRGATSLWFRANRPRHRPRSRRRAGRNRR